MNVDLAKVLTNKGVQYQLRQALRHRPSFQVDETLPETLREKLERLDRTVAEKSKPKGSI